METEFGDNYDHYSDYIFIIFVLYYIFFKIIFINNKIKFIIIFVIFTATIHLGCTEHYFDSKNNVNNHLSKIKILCPNKNIINLVKLGGSGSFILLIFILLMFYTKK